MIKAIFFDIDGTLVSFKTHKIAKSAIEAIEEIKKNGIKVFIATGRLIGEINNLGHLKFDGYITVNGGYCSTSDNKEIFKSSIPKEDLKAIIEYQKNKDKFPFSFMLKEGTVINFIDDKVRYLSNMVNLPLPKVEDLSLIANNDNEDVFQINIYVDREKEKQLMKDVFVNCMSSRWNDLFADVNVRGNSKEAGIDKFLEYYNIDIKETMAFGDGGNDVGMLKHVAIGIAMDNAVDEAKEAADYITDCVDNDGVYKALKHFDIIK